ncbi:hypothetical protein PBRA_008392, partial [Plasmodiophora brassicae]
SSSSTSDDDDDDDAGDDDDADAGVVVQKRDARTRTTVRNLRIREDRAKYLINLDVDSAYYDSKSRSMRDNPYAGTGVGADQVAYAGDNFVRASGDVHDFHHEEEDDHDAYLRDRRRDGDPVSSSTKKVKR